MNQNSDYEKLRACKRELEDFKLKYSQKVLEADDLRKEKDKLKDEKTELLAQYAK